MTHLVQAMEMYRRLEPPDSTPTAKGMDSLGRGFQRAGRLTEAEALLEQALAMRMRLYKGDHSDLAQGLSNLGGAQLARKRFAEAEATQRRALEMRQRLARGDNKQLALALQDLAVILRDAGRPAQAEPFELQAVEMYRRLFPGGSAELSLALYTLGSVLKAAGRVADAVPLFEAALEMDRRIRPAGHKDLLSDIESLALAYYLNGRYEKAIPLYEEALTGYEATLGRQHLLTLITIGNLGANYRFLGRVPEAIRLLEEAWNSAKGRPELQFVSSHLLHAYVQIADPAKESDTARAMALFDELLAASRAKLGKESPELARELSWMSLRLIDLRAWDRAERLLREVQAIRERVQPDVWSTFNTKSMLGGALLGQKRYAEAEPLLLAGYRGMQERAAKVIEENGSVRIPQALERLVKLYEAKGDATEAAAWRAKLEEARLAESRPASRKGG